MRDAGHGIAGIDVIGPNGSINRYLIRKCMGKTMRDFEFQCSGTGMIHDS